MQSRKTQLHSVRLILLRGLGLGTVVFLFAVGAQWLVYEHILAQPGEMRLISPLIAAFSTAIFSARLQIEQRDEWLASMKRYRLIGEMNHHVRNALQVIAWSPYSELKDKTANISEAVQRIEWTLREVLPELSDGGNQRVLGVQNPSPRLKAYRSSGGF